MILFIFNFPHLIITANLSPIMLIKLLLFFLTLLMIVSSRSKEGGGGGEGWLAHVRDKAQRCGVQKCKDTMVYK